MASGGTRVETHRNRDQDDQMKLDEVSARVGCAFFCLVAGAIGAVLAVWKAVEIIFWLCRKAGIE